MENDEKWMRLALQQAHQADYQTWQNPRVGAVIVKDQQLVSVGHTHQFGGFHAERDAISRAVPEQLAGATLYVTLEPCNHYGKQPPCTQLIVEAGIKRMVVAETDPHSIVRGKGIQYLRDHDIEVTTGVLADEASTINAHYNHYFHTHRPWITLKQAISLDGKVAFRQGKRTRITNDAVYHFVHRERAWFHGIMIGSQTAIIDNPLLTVHVKTTFPPVRIVIDRRGRLANHRHLKLLQTTLAKTWVFSSNRRLSHALSKTHAEVIILADCSIKQVIKECGRRGLQSLYVEGGPTLQQSLVDEDLVDEVITYVSPQFVGKQGVAGVQIPTTRMLATNVKLLDSNIRIEGKVTENV
ncbi:bifunctional diaminohydroxyphosphoribosylaminopyrimidine deaminase/5-amino-6-(5-phosphoribosylamino)uracil reductase RibD [uncultured Limosilactobacillus sp.]|uniref:bifunctional diaminohydroxyphosphoribosylaminopyrimidine deaminase/5-amino-6-(5-phosphoribosylamino)uracil reductase RibD n=1 Tax=uncultured Limosilactobacillus sp. TaxID=2837629 RepID=UPI0025EF4B2E|nr:bifunctional diaminohydroxyphosphoribosylaminopyrimidine deaminase/5-amino-6-(5-phosphoribosylamino)uracil reductase RibD [uncultured Limosilactobacillus sp.]